MTVNKGAYRFDDVSFGSSFKEPNKKRSVLEVAAGGTLSVGTLDFSNGDVQIGGQLNADKLVWEDKQYGNETTHVSGPVGTITVSAEGVLSTVAKDNLAKQDEEGKWTTTEVVEHITNNGTLEITDAFSAKAEDVKDYLVQAQSAFGGDVIFKNVTLTDEKVDWAPELGMITLNTTVALPEADGQGVASAQLGAALTVGTADADSEGGVLSNSLSSDFVGLSVYASKDFSGLNVKADLGYIDFSNDFSGLGDASDASTITFGVRGDFTAYQNGAFSIAPHFGLRYTRIDTDAVAFNDEQNMNVFEAPVGVKFAGTFETAGWKVVPSYDFTIVPQLGDKDVEAFGTAGDVTILSGGLYNPASRQKITQSPETK